MAHDQTVELRFRVIFSKIMPHWNLYRCITHYRIGVVDHNNIIALWTIHYEVSIRNVNDVEVVF